MALTGPATGAPRLAPGRVVTRADCLLEALRAAAADPGRLPDDAGALFGERAAIAGLARNGRISAGGRARLLRTGDAWIALQLARPEDVELLPAWLEIDPERLRESPWPAVATAVLDRPAADLVARARLLGLPAAPVGRRAEAPPWLRVTHAGTPRRPRDGPWRVLDLSSLWAGPLATHLLAGLGARVVKVESAARPDGARLGPAAFFDLLNAGKESVALDLRTPQARASLRRLFAWADLVVESARPRALAQLGFDAEDLLAEHPGLSWLSITGYGRPDPRGTWVAFGDDAAAAGGLVAEDADGAPLFCADALADPLTGLHAAWAAACALRAGGGALLDVSLCGVASDASAGGLDPLARVVSDGDGDGDRVVRAGCSAPVAPPRARRPAGRARPLGADTAAVLREVGA
jgi:hypothetical protein